MGQDLVVAIERWLLYRDVTVWTYVTWDLNYYPEISLCTLVSKVSLLSVRQLSELFFPMTLHSSGQGACCDGTCICRNNSRGFTYRHSANQMDCACPPAEEVCRADANVRHTLYTILHVYTCSFKRIYMYIVEERIKLIYAPLLNGCRMSHSWNANNPHVHVRSVVCGVLS